MPTAPPPAATRATGGATTTTTTTTHSPPAGSSTTSPQPSGRASAVPSAAWQERERAALERLSDWSPSGQFASVCSEFLNPATIVALGVVQNVSFLEQAWHAYKKSGTTCPDVVDAFVQAFALCIRRCPSQIQPLVSALILEDTASLAADTYVRLAHIVADLGTKAEAGALLTRATADPRAAAGLSLPFYLALLRLSTETMTPPDLALAVDVCERMTAADIAHSAITLRLLCTGMSRMADPPVETAIRILKYRMDVSKQQVAAVPESCSAHEQLDPERTTTAVKEGAAAAPVVESCLLQGFLNVLDSAVGSDAALAAECVRSLPCESLHDLIREISPERPTLEKSGCFVADVTRYVIVDPLTADLSAETVPIPEHTYLIFLYSSVRALAMRANSVCSVCPVTKKRADLTRLLATNRQAVLVPYDTELSIRESLPPGTDRPNTPQDRLALFARIIHASQCNAFCYGVLSNDPTLKRVCAESGIALSPVLSQEFIAAITPSTSAPACPSGRADGGDGGKCGLAGAVKSPLASAAATWCQAACASTAAKKKEQE